MCPTARTTCVGGWYSGAKAWFLENVRALRESYRALGSDLIVREGVPHEVLGRLAVEAKVGHAHYIRDHAPYARERDEAADRALREAGVEVHAHPGQYTPPRRDHHRLGRAIHRLRAVCPQMAPASQARVGLDPRPTPAHPGRIALGDIPSVRSDVALPEAGEEAALARLESFLRDGESTYATACNFPTRRPGTSLLSMDFNIGALGPRVAVRRSGDEQWSTELAWWDFNSEGLDHHPEGATLEYKEAWRGFPWRDDEAEARRWREGTTGFPMFDAGMRQLRDTGFMHNLARLVPASFLTRHLLIDWRDGESIFRGLLLCGDSAQNIDNWQWVAGCGYDASPYFRVLNPVSQGERFDPTGDYVRRWLPELAGLPGKAVHRPWRAPGPPGGYPAPMIGLVFGRERFLETARGLLRRSRRGASE